MATEAQNEANRKNATASTGPKTSEGKSKSSRNAVSHGLFSTRDILQPGENNEFNELATAMQHDLAPEGALEQTLADEITRAAWRLRRCANVEDGLLEQVLDPCLDPMANTATAPTQIAVDRARLQTHRILQRSITELRRLQNERRFRIEVVPDEVNTGNLGLASYKDLMPSMAAEKRWQLLKRQLEGLGSFESMIAAAVGPQAAPPNPAKQTQSTLASAESNETKRTQFAPSVVSIVAPNGTPRNAPCPCGSGQKHKRCCGKNAPAVLSMAA